MCEPRGSYGSSCPGGNYQCDQVGTGLSCINSVCDCQSSPWFWTGSACAQCPFGW